MNTDSPPAPPRNGFDAEAMDWALRVADPAFEDWSAFTLWLEGGADRAGRYDAMVERLAEIDKDVAAGSTPSSARPLPPPQARKPARPRRPARRAVLAIAAVLVAAVGAGVWLQQPQRYAIDTPPGASRTIQLDDGSTIALAGGSRIRLDHRAPRYASVEQGQALFHVVHDAERPFRVDVGALELQDLGTVFDVKRTGDLTRVAVSEGVVVVNPKGAALRLDPGQAVEAVGDRLERQAIDSASVGGWRGGHLAYDRASLSEVATDLSRHLGRSVTVSPIIARRRFQGAIDLRSVRDDARILGDLLDVRVRAEGDGWILEPRE